MAGRFAAGEGVAFGHDFEARNGRRIAVELPADEAFDAIAFLHAGALEHPVAGLGADPVAAAIEGINGMSAHEQVGLWGLPGGRDI